MQKLVTDDNQPTKAIHPIILDKALALLFNKGKKGWDHVASGEGAQGYYKRTFTIPKDAQEAISIPSLSHAVSTLLIGLGAPSILEISKDAACITVFVPDDLFDEKIEPYLGANDARKLATIDQRGR